MQERYRSINNIFFCSDYIVDGLLYDFKISRQKQQKKTDILFQNYDRGLIRQEDIVEILLSLMECGVQAEKISLHAAAMKNQLILCMTEQSLSKQLGQSNQEGGERDKKKRLKVYDLFHLGYGNAKTLFKRLNMVGISREMIEKELENEGYSD